MTSKPKHANEETGLEIVAYRLHDSPPPLVSAQRTRAWMDLSDQRFAYRCLPLLIANQSGLVRPEREPVRSGVGRVTCPPPG